QPGSITASPALDYAFIAVPSNPGAAPERRGLIVLPLAKDEPALFFDVANQALAASPNGNNLFVMQNDVLIRFDVNKELGQLVQKQTSNQYQNPKQPPFNNPVNDARRIDVSPDSKNVCVSRAFAPPALQQKPFKGDQTAGIVYHVD